jgi:hypothetical protein
MRERELNYILYFFAVVTASNNMNTQKTERERERETERERYRDTER